MKHLLRLALAAAAAAVLTAGPAAHAAVVYSNDFEANTAPGWSGAGSIQSPAGLVNFGFGKHHWRNDSAGTSTLTVSGLAAHTALSFSFDLAMWDTIDQGDRFVIRVDGVAVYDSSSDFFNFGNDNKGHGPGVLITPDFGDRNTPDFGFGNARDSARSASFTLAHSGFSAEISFAYPNSQGGLDESFGIDNIVVSSTSARLAWGRVGGRCSAAHLAHPAQQSER
jgi:hypothetical protein